MLITFKSKSTADVIMYAEHAKPILDFLHKDLNRGVITPGEMMSIIQRLEKEIHARHQHKAAEDVVHDVHTHFVEDHPPHHHEAVHEVSFSARCFPLLEMLRASVHDKNDILWGV